MITLHIPTGKPFVHGHFGIGRPACRLNAVGISSPVITGGHLEHVAHRLFGIPRAAVRIALGQIRNALLQLTGGSNGDERQGREIHPRPLAENEPDPRPNRVRKLTPEELKERFGGGLIIFGIDFLFPKNKPSNGKTEPDGRSGGVKDETKRRKQ
jgi:hypothetical protein